MRYDEVSIYGVDANGNRKVIKVASDGTLIISVSPNNTYTVQNFSITTNTVGTSFAIFSDIFCKQIVIANTTNTDIEYQRNAAGVAFPIPAQSAKTIIGITNSNQIGIRRIDQNNTQITLFAEIINY